MRRIDDDPESASTAVSGAYKGSGERAAFVIRVVEGPDTGASAGIDETTASPLLVGQSAVCALRLTDREVSRRHLAFELSQARLRVTDQGSTNGTFVGELAIVDALLAGGEQLRIGATKLRVDRVPASGATLGSEESFGRLLGRSAAMRRLYPLIARLAAARMPIIVEGETGTGKELLAETLHAAGPRAREPFVVFDCAAQASESELFGEGTRAGVFELAHRGTLLIDEIADLAAPLQSKLLRAIDRGEIRRVAGAELLRVDVRVIATTRKNLDEEVQAGRFREELFHRIAVARIELPPLRKREGDVRLLAEHFVRELGGDLDGKTRDAIARWERAPFPGNVRQLRNAVAQHVAEGDLAADDAPTVTTAAGFTRDLVDEAIASGLPLPVARLQVVKEFERRYIEAVLAKHGGNVVRAAEASGIARRYFQILRGQKRR